MTINLCQALNRLGRHAEVLDRIAKLDRELSTADTRLRFLAQLEEGRALAGLGRIEEAGNTLGRAKKLISHTETDAFERAEQKEAEAELKLLKGDLSGIEELKAVAKKFVDQELVVRATNVHLALAEAMFKLGQDQIAYEILSSSLIGALRSNLVELADRIRADMIKNAKRGQLEELTETIELIGGASSLNRRFILLCQLGKGGAGEVFKALDVSSGQHVALKTLDLASYSSERRKYLLNSIKTEYGAALGLAHPGIARVRDLLIEPAGKIHVVQDYIDGPTLRQLYLSGVSKAHLLGLLAEVADALVALHAKGIVHRDLKPENVVVRGGTSPVLIDMGIASQKGQPDAFKHVGTRGYIAPEQIRGDVVDFKADIYALGKMIADIWGGLVPSSLSLIFQPRTVTQGQSPPQIIRRLVRRMLKKNPNRRLSNLQLIASTLRIAASQNLE